LELWEIAFFFRTWLIVLRWIIITMIINIDWCFAK
jgi:hypothetical protein